MERTALGRLAARFDPRTGAVSGPALGCLFGTWLLSVVTQGYIIVPASVLPRIVADLSVSQSTAVWLISATPGAWAASNFAVGFVLDRRGAVWLTTLATAVFVVTGLVGWRVAAHGNFGALLGTRVVAGVVVGAIWTASADVVGRTFDSVSEGTALGVFTTSAPAGFALGQVGTPVVADAAGWPAIFAIAAALAAVAYVVFLLGVSNATVADPAHDTSVRADVRTILGNRTVLAGCLLAFAAYSLYLFLNSWMPTYLQTRFGMSLRLSGLLAALFPAMGVLSRAGGGVVSDRLFDRRRLPVLVFSFAVALPSVILIAVLDSPFPVVLVLVVAGAVIQLTFGVVYSYVRDGVSPALSGTALSFLGTAGIAGAFSAPLITGALIGATEQYATAFAFAAVLALGGLALALRAPNVN